MSSTKLTIGIVGLPNVGKSTLFHALTKKQVNIANYPFCTIDPNVGVVAVPDERLLRLANLSNSAKVVPAIVEFVDIAGLVRGAYKGEGLGNQFLSHVRDVAAIIEVLRVFPSEEIIHVENSVDPLRDMDIINMELILKDVETIEKRLGKAEGEARTGKKELVKQFEVLKEVHKTLQEGKRALVFKDEPIIKELQLLTAKPVIYLLNGKAEDVSEELRSVITKEGSGYIVLNVVEDVDFSPLIQEAYRILNLISFFTTGEDETRSWTIVRGAKAPEAAGAIHSDFEKKFIRAEVIATETLLFTKGWSDARSKGSIRLEGRDYVVNEGDVMVIRHG